MSVLFGLILCYAMIAACLFYYIMLVLSSLARTPIAATVCLARPVFTVHKQHCRGYFVQPVHTATARGAWPANPARLIMTARTELDSLCLVLRDSTALAVHCLVM